VVQAVVTVLQNPYRLLPSFAYFSRAVKIKINVANEKPQISL
jgi:hypothetical protein